MLKLNCIIIEDEPLATKVLLDYIAKTPFLHCCQSFKDAVYASDYLNKNKVDVIFLDIHLPQLKGVDFLKTLLDPPYVIITSAYNEYAIQGYELNVVDYLLKPFEFQRFFSACNKVFSIYKNQTMLRGSSIERDYIFISVQKKKVKIMFSEIMYIESQKEYIRICTVNGDYNTKMSTHEIEAILPNYLFKRIHRSFIVSMPYIHALSSNEVEIQDKCLPVGRAYKNVLKEMV